MSVKIGSARIDENGHACGGRAGDQTGREVSTQSWYRHAKGWRVFRARSPQAAEKIARNMQCACDNRHIGYDQYQRLTLYEVSKPLGFDCKQVKADCETDCSALVRVCCAYAGIRLPNFRTTDEPAALLNSGAFAELTGAKYTDQSAYLRRGDILVTRTQGHTVVVLSDGPKAGPAQAEPAEPQTPASQYVTVTGGTVNLRAAPGTDAPILAVVRAGDRLPWGGESRALSGRSWHRVLYKGGEAWISGKYSRVEA